MRIAIVGAGYVGLTTGAGFADFGNEVMCADVDEEKVARLRRGEVPFHEPGLSEQVAENTRAGRLSFTTDASRAVMDAEVVFIAVGTPSTSDGHADLTQVLAAADAVGRARNCRVVVVTKSTVPVGTTDRVRDAVLAWPGPPASFAANPEFLKEGTAVMDFRRPDRVVLGVEDETAGSVLSRLYAPFVRDPAQILVMDVRSAELTKYAANAMLATRISFMNDVAHLCEALGADIHHVRHGIGADPRIGDQFLYAGVGFGGSCFSKDVQALIATGQEVDAMPCIAAAALRVNVRQRGWFVEKIKRHFDGDLRDKRIAVWGLAFKPGTDDVRDAPAIDIIKALLRGGATVHACDPAANLTATRCFQGGDAPVFVEDAYEAASGANALVLVTEWRVFRSPNWKRLRDCMAAPVLFDGRNAWDTAAAHAAGFTYYGIGRRLP